MNVVYLIQAGDDGPVRIDVVALERLARETAALQRGAVDVLTIRRLHPADEHARLLALGRPHLIRDAWHHPAILDAIPDTMPQLPFDLAGEARRAAAARLADLARRPA